MADSWWAIGGTSRFPHLSVHVEWVAGAKQASATGERNTLQYLALARRIGQIYNVYRDARLTRLDGTGRRARIAATGIATIAHYHDYAFSRVRCNVARAADRIRERRALLRTKAIDLTDQRAALRSAVELVSTDLPAGAEIDECNVNVGW
jgi:hypothetical protein